MSRSRKDILETEAMLTRLTALLVGETTGATYGCRADAEALRRISMTLHRWHELECGDSNGVCSWCITRGEKKAQWAIQHANNSVCWWDGEFWATKDRRKTFDGKPLIPGAGKPDHVLEFAKAVRVSSEFIHDDSGAPFIERHYYPQTVGQPGNRTTYSPIPDRERGARNRLATILKRYPTLTAYVQTDPRGCALYILKPGDVPKGGDVSAYYSRGLAVFQ